MSDWLAALASKLADPAPLDVHVFAAAGPRDARRFEYSAGGDRVPGHLWVPADPPAQPKLAVLQCAFTHSVDERHAEAVGPLLERGLSVLAVDWPLHGARASVKLTERLFDALASAADDPNGANLLRHFALQAVTDLSRGLGAATAILASDPKTFGAAGVGPAARLLAAWASAEPAINRTALAIAPPSGPHWPTLAAGLGPGAGDVLLLVTDEASADLPTPSDSVTIEPWAGPADALTPDLATRLAAHLANDG